MHNCTTHIIKGRVPEPSHPISTRICNIPRTQSEADEHKKGQGIHEMSFQAPKQNSYSSMHLPGTVSMLLTKSPSSIHAPFHITTRFLSLSLPVKPPLNVTSSRSRSINFYLEGTNRVDSQHSLSIKKNFIHQQWVSVFEVQISVLEGRHTITPSNQWATRTRITSSQTIPSSQSINGSQFIKSRQIGQRTTESPVTLL